MYLYVHLSIGLGHSPYLVGAIRTALSVVSRYCIEHIRDAMRLHYQTNNYPLFEIIDNFICWAYFIGHFFIICVVNTIF